jgi:hypothetical protein
MAWGTIAAPPLLEPGPGGFFSLDLSWRRWDSEQGLGCDWSAEEFAWDFGGSLGWDWIEG